MSRLVTFHDSEHAPVRTVQTRNKRKLRNGGLPFGHVTTEQLKADAERGIEYFWSKRPQALRHTGDWFFDFKRPRSA